MARTGGEDHGRDERLNQTRGAPLVNTRRKVIVLVLAFAALATGVLWLPRLVRRIDSFFDPAWEKGAVQEAAYREMTNVFRVASEMTSGHPSRRLYDERKASLLASGYLETRDLVMRQPFPSRRATQLFMQRFAQNFPGVEFMLRGLGEGERPIIAVTAPKEDFGAFGRIEQFVRQYDVAQGTE